MTGASTGTDQPPGVGRHGRPLRLLVVCPSWVGDAVMATPALRRLREGLPGATIQGLMRPGIDAVLDGGSERGPAFFDEVHVDRPRGVMGHKHAAAKLRMQRFDTALLLTNSFSTALTARLAGIPRRVGYERDGRGLLLTHRLVAPKTGGGAWAMVPAVDYYWHAAGAVLSLPDRGAHTLQAGDPLGGHRLPNGVAMEMPISDEDGAAGARVLEAAGVSDRPFAVLNPGGNNEAKRWPAERFGEIARRLNERGLAVVVNGSPAEADVIEAVGMASGGVARSLLDAGGSLRALKVVVREASILVTNDTGPRHFAAALGTPVVTLFGPTDHRWTCVPARGGEAVLVADPSLPPEESANDHPERCRVDRITTERVWEAAAGLLDRR